MTLKKKKTPFIVEEEKPAPSMTRGSVTVEGKPPVQRIDLTNDQGFKDYAKSAFERADTESYKKSTPRFEKDALVLPDGRRLTGTFDELNTWRNAYLNLKGIKNPEIAQTQRAEIQAGLDKDALKKQMIKEQTPIPEELAQVGQFGELPQDETSASILENIDKRKQESIFTADRLTIGNAISPLISPNKLIGSMPNTLGIKGAILNLAGQNEELRNYLSDYSNEDNFDKIKNDIRVSDAEIAAAKDLALQPGYSKEAMQIYNAALAKKQRSYSQLKMISQGDQRKYVKDIKFEMIELESYFMNQKLNDDLDMKTNIFNSKNGGFQLG